MKIIKLFFAIVIISLIAVSCKETKKEEPIEDSIEVADESIEATEESVEATNESVEVPSGETTELNSKSEEEGVETTTKGLEDIPLEDGVIAEKMADTPVAYPGCTGSADEIRACSIMEFKKFFGKKFNIELANSLDLDEGDHKIRALLKISETGKVSVIKIEAGKVRLEKEVIRVIDLYPLMTPATKNGKPISVSFILPVNFKVV